MKPYYDLRVLQRQYVEGDIIYLLDTAAVKGKSCKLRNCTLEGPSCDREKTVSLPVQGEVKECCLYSKSR